jgi:cytochrome c-type biogenesis protein CcmH/NrfG/predicted Ser/Thr protein kinase
MSDATTRLELALEAFLAFQKAGGSRADLLARHPQFADLLEAMLEVEGEPEPPPGVNDFGEFELLREVGRGGVGVVHEARQRNLDRRVALKVLHAPFANDPMVLARFRREANTLAKLDHTGIVRVLDVGEADGRPWLAMEFVEGESLAARLDRLRQQGGHRDDSLRRLLEIVTQVAEALHHAHEAGVVHRDVKPNNVLLRGDGRAVLGDFGLAREATDLTLTREGTVAGTPYYMSPEQIVARSSQCDQRSDVFSLGATLYECITLERPFDGPTPEIVLHRILTREPRDPRRKQKRLPQDLVAIVLKALEKEPERRYQTMHEFAEDLRAFLELRPVQARPPSRARRLLRWARREPMRAALGLVLLGAVGMGTWFVWRLPDLRAGELARNERQYETELAEGLMARANEDRQRATEHLGRALALFPARGEAVAMWCLGIRHFDGPAAGLRELEQHEAIDDRADLEWLRVLLLRRVGRTAEADALEQRLGEPRSATSLWLAGVLRLEGDQISAAERRRALTLVSLATRVAASPRLLLHLQWSACARIAGDAIATRESAESLVRLWPDNPVALHYAAANLQNEDPARAASLQQRAIDLGLSDANLYRNLAAYLAKAGRHPEWIAPMHKHLELHPDDKLRAAFLAMLLDKHEPGMVKAEAEQWLREVPDQPDALCLLGELAADEDVPRALELLHKAAALRPADADILYELATVLHSVDTPETDAECRQWLTKVLELQPAHERAHKRLLDLLESQRDAAALRAECERWLASRPDDTAGWIRLADTLLASKDPALLGPALSACERADALEKGRNAAVLQLKAKILDALHCDAAAAACREQARALGK